MRRTILVLGVVTALAGTAFAVVSDSSNPGPASAPGGVEHARARTVADAPAQVAARPLRAGGSIVYKQTKPRVVEPGLTAVDVGKCPRGSVAISGYYWYDLAAGQTLSEPVVTDVGGTPWGRSSRKWLFYASVPQPGAGVASRGIHPEGSVENVVFGIICAKDHG